MIITDIKQIDRIAEEAFGNTKGIISVDMKDYAFIKKQSSSLKAIKLDISEITKRTLTVLDDALNEICMHNECNLIMYINAGGNVITVEQMELIHISIETNVPENSNIVWGMGENINDSDGFTILIIVGFCK